MIHLGSLWQKKASETELNCPELCSHPWVDNKTEPFSDGYSFEHGAVRFLIFKAISLSSAR